MTQQKLTDYASEVDGSSPDRYVPDTCIGFDVAADFAHFRKVGNTSAKPSYRIPPRTTVAGLLAGIMGMPRDSYYDLFSPSSSAIAVVPKTLPHTYTMGITTVNTSTDAIQYVPLEKDRKDSAKMLTPESYLERWDKPGRKDLIETPRQRDTYQMLVDPVYRVYVALGDGDVHDELRERLETSRYYYSPALGLSECIADIRNVDTHPVEPAVTDAVDSATYDDSAVVPRPGVTITRERAPLYMEAVKGGRRTTEFGNITYATGDDRLPVDKGRAHTIGEHEVVLY